MKLRKRQNWLVYLVVVVALLMTIYMGSLTWRASATPFGAKKESPDGKYYIQFYSVWTLSRLAFTAPGQGSDNIDGFIRLYNHEGKLLEETFRTYLVAYSKVVWTEDSVFFLGDGPSWRLPAD